MAGFRQLEGGKTVKRYAISDPHGNARPFIKLLEHVDPDPEELVIVGDLGDRGLETWEVYEECEQLLDEGADIVIGNHDRWLYEYLMGKLPEHIFKGDAVGGITTIKSLELARKKYGNQKVTDTVIRVLTQMKPYYEDDNFIFVHAGIDPLIPYMDQQKIDVLTNGTPKWSNPVFEHTFEQFVVFGHTPTYLIHKGIQENDARIWTSNKARKIGIDTGAGFGNRLTMVDLWEGIAYAYDFASREIIDYQFRRAMKMRK